MGRLPFSRILPKKLGSPYQSLRSCRGRGCFRAESLSGVLLSGSSGPRSCRAVQCAVTPREGFPACRSSHARLPGGRGPCEGHSSWGQCSPAGLLPLQGFPQTVPLQEVPARNALRGDTYLNQPSCVTPVFSWFVFLFFGCFVFVYWGKAWK